jgi:SSS family solute:Na+ symporter
MSTLSSLMFISASTIGRDIVGRLSSASTPANQEMLVQRWTKIGLVLSAVFSIVLSLIVPSVVKIWYTIGTAIVPGLLIPLMASYFESLRIPSRHAFWAMLIGWGASTVSLLFGQMHQLNGEPSYFLGVEPMYPGLVLSLVVWGLGRMRYKKEKVTVTSQRVLK